MTLKAICRIGDTCTGTCQVPGGGHPRSFTATWTTGSTTAFAEGIGVVRVGDTGLTDCGHTIQATVGSSVATNNGIRIHRVGDAVVVVGGGFGASTTGSPTAKAED